MSIMTHPQQPDAFAAYGSYNGGMGNRSPNSTRNGYSTLPSGMGANRQPSQRQQQQQQQQQMDAAGQQGTSMYPMMDRYGILDSITRGPPTVSGMPGEYMAGNQSAWNYNGGGSSATVNGPIPDVRSRSVNRRPGIPDYWMQQPDPTSHPGIGLQAPNQPVYTPQGVPYGQVMSGMDQLRSQPHMFSEGRQSHHDKKDDLIPTAIVIKNIPFNVRKEVLQAIMMEMNLPQPYAFNYHFDNGVFRGLAFANFSSADETRQVIDRMNQLDVQGRKLRVEYKKMLPEHERERIEREKRQKRGQLEEQHRPMPTLQHQASLQSLHSRENDAAPSRSSPSRDYDLNDPATLNNYIKMRSYREDANNTDYLVFDASTAPEERRVIHILAHNMGLHHGSYGTGDSRCAVVWKENMGPPDLAVNSSHTPVSAVDQLQYPANSKSLARAATIDFGEQRTSSTNGYGTIGRHGNPALEVPDSSPDGLNNIANLRTIRSMAELGRPGQNLQARTPSPRESGYPTSSLRLNEHGLSSRPDLSSAFGGLAATPTTPGGSLNHRASDLSLSGVTNNLSSLSVAEGPYEATRLRENPGAIGSQRPGVNGLSSRNAPERQPRGPETGWENVGFNGRRVNGHAQRGSDSSENFHGSGASSSLYSH
ncbi:R3H domain-containing protein [Diaporthe amygdali]|uniref:R3H domain-containing protein n=1 Tax=Phomopsis amygdali TaxID=1214568 RepID=UPI0022FE87C5|nr:R3H domain-containing protein [Diaporthe amygdali]KAJ0120917.1 R3H domain-containing protein [Diaporthe amygdali]